MALESATYISDLVSTNPTSSDPLAQGDDHLRLLKSTLKATFPNVSGAVTPTHTELNVLDGLTASTAELNYVDGVTSAIQTQIDAKAPLANPTFTGTVVLPSTTSVGSVSSTELGYLDGVTSGLQSQIDAKAPLASPTFTGTPTAPTASAYTNTTQIATTAQVYSTATVVPQNYKTSTAYTLELVDIGTILLMDNSSPVTVTIPNSSSVSFPTGARIDIFQSGAGQVTITPAAGVTRLSSGTKSKLSGQFSAATLIYNGANTWLLIGDLA